MTDCFQPIEEKHRITYQVIKELKKRRIGYLIVTKSALAADDEYLKIYDPELAHIQVTIISTDDIAWIYIYIYIIILIVIFWRTYD